jgi:hypothetical protein
VEGAQRLAADLGPAARPRHFITPDELAHPQPGERGRQEDRGILLVAGGSHECHDFLDRVDVDVDAWRDRPGDGPSRILEAAPSPLNEGAPPKPRGQSPLGV